MRKRHNKEKKQKHEIKIKTAWGFFLETKIDAGSRVFFAGKEKKNNYRQIRIYSTVHWVQRETREERKPLLTSRIKSFIHRGADY